MTTEITQPDSQTNVVQETQEQQQVVPQEVTGVQLRINELTAARREAERQAQMAAEQNARLTEALTKMAAQQLAPQAPPLPALPEGVDPALADAIAQIANRSLNPYLKQIEAQMALQQQFQEQLRLQQASADLPLDVQAQSAQLLGDWRKAGLQGWLPEDAAVHALGLKVKAALASGNAEVRKALFGTNAQIAQAVRQSAPPSMMHAAPPPAQKPAAVPELPDDLDMSVPGNAELALAALRKKFTNE